VYKQSNFGFRVVRLCFQQLSGNPLYFSTILARMAMLGVSLGIVCPQVADGGDALQLWRAAANILTKQSRTADKGWSSSLGVGRGANNSSA
jgi:hypothetical protein